MELRRSKNAATYIVAPIVDADGDIVTGAAGLDSELNYWDDGNAPQASFSDCTNEATEIGSTGIYYLSLTQAEMNHDYVYVIIKTSTSGAKSQHVLINCKNQPADVLAISGDTTAADNCELMFDGTGYAGGTTRLDVNAVTVEGTDATNAIRDAVVDDATRIDASALNTLSSHDPGEAIMGATDIGTGSGLSAIPWNAAWDAEVQSECTDALNAYDPPTRAEATSDANAVIAALPAAAPTAAAIADAVWDEASTGHTDAGKAGQQLWTDVDAILADTGTDGVVVASIAAGAVTAAAVATGAIDADAIAADAVTELQAGLSTLDAAGVRTAVGLAAANLDTQLGALPTAAENADAVWDEALAGHAGAGSAGATLSAASAPSAADVADAVWNETLADHLAAGSTGNALNAAGSAGDPWATALPGAYGAGSAGLLLGTTIPAAIDAVDNYVDTEVGALATELAKVPKSDGAASWNATALAAIQSEAADALNAYDPPTKAELDEAVTPLATSAEVGALNDFDPASDVVAHVTLVDTTTTNTDMVAAAPAASAVADAVWDEAMAGHAAAGSTGAALSAATAPSAASVADAVWDESLAAHAGAGSAGAALSAAGVAGDPWTAELPGDYEEGTAGAILPALESAMAVLGSADVTVTSPVAASGEVTVYAGDDYDATYGREISFTVSDATHALGLDNVAAVLRFKCAQATWTGAAVSTATGYTVTFEPTDAQTALLTTTRQAYELDATLADGDVVTLATGTLVVVKDIPAV